MNNIYQEFIIECITRESDPVLAETTEVSLFDVYQRYRTWHMDNYPGVMFESKYSIMIEMNRHVGTERDNFRSWKGYKINDEYH